MKTFELTGKVTISVYTKVEAETLEEAKEIAEQRSIEQYQYGQEQMQEDYWISEEYDGTVFDVVD